MTRRSGLQRGLELFVHLRRVELFQPQERQTIFFQQCERVVRDPDARWAAIFQHLSDALDLFQDLGVCLWFRAGVERGVIITSASQLDQAVEREASALAREGGVAAGPRAVGALNRAIGEMPSAVGTRAQAASLEDALDEAAAAAGELTGEATGAAEMRGRRGRSAADRAFKRLI